MACVLYAPETLEDHQRNKAKSGERGHKTGKKSRFHQLGLKHSQHALQ